MSTAACWHCADPPAKDRIIRVPLIGGVIAGCFCSFSCAKRWCIDTRHTEAIVGLVISNDGASITAAPPRHCLKRFGGPFEPRASDRVQSVPPLGTPLKLTAAVQNVPVGGRQDSLFREFVKQRRYVNTGGPPPVAKPVPKKKRTSRSRPRKDVASGTLAAFIVPVAAAEKNP